MITSIYKTAAKETLRMCLYRVVIFIAIVGFNVIPASAQSVTFSSESPTKQASIILPEFSPSETAGNAGVTVATTNQEEKAAPVGWWQRINFSGDFRSRHEGFYQKDRKGGRRDRTRMRLRLRIDTDINDSAHLAVQIASGDPGTPVSTNQTFTSFFRPKPVAVDRAFVALNPTSAPALTLAVGKYGLPVKHTQMLFDNDLNVEGGFERVSWNVSPNVGIDLIALQTAVNEVSRGTDTYMLAGYGAINFDLGESSFHISAANYGYSNMAPVAIGHSVGPLKAILTNELVRNANGTITGYASRFNVIDVISEARFQVGQNNFPVRLLAEYSRNTWAANDRDSGFWTEVEFGSAGDVGSLEGSYTYGWIQQDVTPSAFVFSDMPGTNLRLHMINTSWFFLPRMSFDFTLHISKRLVPTAGKSNHWLFRPHTAFVVRF